MTGALLSLAARGRQDDYLTVDADITLWKSVYRRHTPFAMESISYDLDGGALPTVGTRTFRFSIPRHGDLVNALYLGLRIPAVRASGARWVRHLGEALVEHVSVYVGGALIERVSGEWLHAFNALSMPSDKRPCYDEMTGNTPRFFGGEGETAATSAGDDGDDDYRPGRVLYVPIPLWFTRSSGQALPLVALQYHTVDVEVALRPLSSLYLVCRPDGTWERPRVSDPADALERFVQTSSPVGVGTGDGTRPLHPFIELGYVFLDDPERDHVARNEHEYLVDQVSYETFEGLGQFNPGLRLPLANPVTRLVWYVEDTEEARERNSHYATMEDAIADVTLLMNGNERFKTRPADYFRFVQPFQHAGAWAPHARDIMSYSFALDNPRGGAQPTGSTNMSGVRDVHLSVSLNPSAVRRGGGRLHVFAVSINVFKVVAGMASTVFAA